MNGTDLLDRLSNLVDRLNEWRDYLQGQFDADMNPGDGTPSPDDPLNERQEVQEESEEWEERPPVSYQEDEPEVELEHAPLDADPQSGAERN